MATKFERKTCHMCGTKLVVWKLVYGCDHNGEITIRLCYPCARKLQNTFNELDIRFSPNKSNRLARAKALKEEREKDGNF